MATTLPHTRSPLAGRARRRWTRWLIRGLLPALVLIVIAHLLDRPVFEALSVSKPELERMEEGGLYRLSWLMGTMWVWVFIASALYLHDRSPPPHGPRPAMGRRRDPGARAIAVAGAALVAGLVAEVLKVFIGRERPTRLVDGQFVEQMYTFKPVLGGVIDGSNLGMPSSHAAVAFAGAAALAFVMPTVRGIALLLAGLCALSRIIASAHTLSDVVVGAAVGVMVAVLFARWSITRTSPGVIPSWKLGSAGGSGWGLGL
ncbi:MAG: phosphatase PAP2 family protein [Salinibacterium sp.]|nr:phosphatase PAP2 family protein [Salinibacterium sp.]